MAKRMIIMLSCLLLLVAGLALGFFQHVRTLKAAAPRPGAQTVSTLKVAALEWQPRLNAVGTVNAVRGVDVTTEIAGMVRELRFKSGQDVRAGEVLVQLNADSDIAQLASLEAAADLASTVLARDQAQLAVQAVAQSVVDSDLTDLKIKRAMVAQQQAMIAKKTIRAPFSGRIGITSVNPGQYLNPGDKIVTLQALDQVTLDFTLPQQQIALVAVGEIVNVSTSAYAGEAFAGTVSAISPKVDAATRHVSVRATVANPQKRLLPGMFARADVDAGTRLRRLTVPQTAIAYNPYGSTVFVLEPAASAGGHVAKQVFVTTGETRGDQVAIVKGLKEGQEVVTSGQMKLRNGTPVVVDNSVQPANSENPAPQEQ